MYSDVDEIPRPEVVAALKLLYYFPVYSQMQFLWCFVNFAWCKTDQHSMACSRVPGIAYSTSDMPGARLTSHGGRAHA